MSTAKAITTMADLEIVAPSTGTVHHAPSARSHVPALDGVRGLAVMLVMLNHLFTSNTHTGSAFVDMVNRIFQAGWVGVDIFFVLSGFLITGILMDTREDESFFKKFYVRRILRIFPLYYGVLIVYALLTLPLHLQWHGLLPYYFVYFANLTSQGPIPMQPLTHSLTLNHFWSLQVEEQFYLVWPFLVYRIRDWRKLLGVAAIFSLVALLLRCVFVFKFQSLQNDFWPYAFTPCRLDSLLGGASLAILARTRYKAKIHSLAWPVFLGCIAILAGAAIYMGSWQYQFHAHPFIPTFGLSLLALASASLLVLAENSGPVRSFFSLQPLRWLGKYSYGLYVLHYPLDSLLTPPIRSSVRHLTGSKGLAVVITAGCIAVLSVGAAYVSYNVYEKHFLRLKRFFEYEKPGQIPTANV